MMYLTTFTRPIITTAGLIALWYGMIWGFDLPKYIAPLPHDVWHAFAHRTDYFADHLGHTAVAIFASIIVGVLGGAVNGFLLLYLPPLRRWILPLLLISQAIPVFALAPLLVMWFGYGLLPKVVMAGLIIFFPVTMTFYDGLRRADGQYITLARTMGATPAMLFWHVRLPACLPLVATGLKMATTLAPIGVIIGEWVGSSRGMGYVLLEAHGRMKSDVMFAGIFIMCAFTITLYYATDALMKRVVRWQTHD